MSEKGMASPGGFVLFYVVLSIVFAALTLLMLFSGQWMTEKISSGLEADLTAGEEGVCILLDAGHGGADGGAIGVNGCLEKEINLKIAQRLHALCQLAGISVRMTRSDDRMLYDPVSDRQSTKKMHDLQNRLAIAEEIPGAVLISIHLNAFPVAKYSGLQVYYSANHPDSVRLAEQVQQRTKNLLQPENTRQIKAADSAIYLLNRCTKPAVLIECGFLTNPQECDRLCDDEYLGALTAVIFTAITDYLETYNTGT